MNRLRRQDGFTVVEMLVAAAVGSIVMVAIFTLLDTSVKQSGGVTARVDSTQRGRTAMEKITRELRSQVCWSPDGGASVPSVTLADAQPYSVTFYGYSGYGDVHADKRTIWWDTNTNSINESIAPGLPATGAVTSFGTAVTNTLITDVTPPPGNAPVFEYQTTAGTVLGATPLSAADRAKAGIIRIRFVTGTGVKGAPTKTTTAFESQVFVRTADPNGVAGTTDPSCS
jgi:prepilin-type N-terminal cleavage/methylation domain-containing protein